MPWPTIVARPTWSDSGISAWPFAPVRSEGCHPRNLTQNSKAIEYFQETINKDPQNARAYAGLADSYALMSGYAGNPSKELMPKLMGRRGGPLS